MPSALPEDAHSGPRLQRARTLPVSPAPSARKTRGGQPRCEGNGPGAYRGAAGSEQEGEWVSWRGREAREAFQRQKRWTRGAVCYLSRIAQTGCST